MADRPNEELEQDGLIGEWIDCWNCGGDGFIEGECTCGDDCCCCLEPDPPVCNVCGGKGGWEPEDD